MIAWKHYEQITVEVYIKQTWIKGKHPESKLTEDHCIIFSILFYETGSVLISNNGRNN